MAERALIVLLAATVALLFVAVRLLVQILGTVSSLRREVEHSARRQREIDQHTTRLQQIAANIAKGTATEGEQSEVEHRERAVEHLERAEEVERDPADAFARLMEQFAESTDRLELALTCTYCRRDPRPAHTHSLTGRERFIFCSSYPPASFHATEYGQWDRLDCEMEGCQVERIERERRRRGEE